MKHAIAILIVSAMLMGALGLAAQAQPSVAATPITLSASGWSDPSVGSWDGTTATLTRDLAQGIVIVSPGIVLDGGGHTLSGDGSDKGVYAKQLANVTVKNLIVRGFGYGIYLEKCSDSTVANNTIGGQRYHGIYLKSSNSTTVTGNTVEGNGDSGIYVMSAYDNILAGNTVRANGSHGIYLTGSQRHTLTGNAMAGNRYNLRVDGQHELQYTHTIDATNSVEGKAVIYLVDANGGTYDAGSNAGTVYLINCSGVTVKDVDLSGNYVGALLWGTTNSRLENLQANRNQHGIWLRSNSNGNTLTGIKASKNASYGIYIEASHNNVLADSEVQENETYGIYLSGAGGNDIHGNRFVGNRSHAYAAGGSNTFCQPKPKGGNFWDDWTIPDSDGDGFVDNPRVFDGGRDDLPLSGVQKVDTAPPVTGLVLDGERGGDGWYRSDVKVTLLAIDNEGGSGVLSSEFRIDDGDWQGYAGPFSIGKEGVTRIAVRSTDNAGNVEPARTHDVRIDKTAPEITIDMPQPGAFLPSGTALSFGARDALSGLAGVSASLFDGLNRWSVTSGQSIDQAGVYDLTVLANDVAGNAGSQTRTFIVPSGEDAKVTGGGWISTGNGKAFVEVNCKNHKNPAVPQGNFSFRDGDLSLKGTGYRWLVVRGSVAWIEGTGAVNGADGYRFQFVADEGKAAGQPDRVRVRIWDQSGALIYDTQPGAEDWAGPTGTLGGGNITVH